MNETLRFTVPMVPPGVNHYVKHTRTGRHYKTPEAEAWGDTLAIFLRGQSVEAKSFYVAIYVRLGKGDKGDVDNFPKLVLDGLAKCGAFRSLKGKLLSDAHVERLLVQVDRKTRPAEGYTEIVVAPLAQKGVERELIHSFQM